MIRAKLVEHIAKMFVLAGEDADEGRRRFQGGDRHRDAVGLASRTPVELRDPLKNYNLMPVKDLQALSPDFDWTGFMKAIDSPSVDKVDVGQPDFVKGWARCWPRPIRRAEGLYALERHRQWRQCAAQALCR
jgi:putative endopeptidase